MRDRLTALYEAQQESINPEKTPLDVEEDEDDYEPDYYTAEDTEQILNKLDSSPAGEHRELEKPAALGGLALPTFRLPPPPTLTGAHAVKAGDSSITKVFGTLRTLDDSAKKMKAGINRLAASSADRESWITLLSRLATRPNSEVDNASEDDEDTKVALLNTEVADTIRDCLFNYVLEDFRKRIDAAVAWLSEEWYNDSIQQRAASNSPHPHDVPLHYEKWTTRLLDGFMPYLHSQDKVLTRFLSELPSLTPAIISRVKQFCQDPSLVSLTITTLYYLVVMKPPARELALDAIQDIWTEYEDARPVAAKPLQRWRPAFMNAQAQQAITGSDAPTAAVVAS